MRKKEKLNIGNVKRYLGLLFLTACYIYVLCWEKCRISAVEKPVVIASCASAALEGQGRDALFSGERSNISSLHIAGLGIAR